MTKTECAFFAIPNQFFLSIIASTAHLAVVDRAFPYLDRSAIDSDSHRNTQACRIVAADNLAAAVVVADGKKGKACSATTYSR